jgi:Lrp/AsnC family leucine-responsive transcriptional regulator
MRPIVDPKAYGLPFSVFVSVRLTQQTQETHRRVREGGRKLERGRRMLPDDRQQDYLLRVLTDGIEGYERFLKQKVTRLKCIQSVESNFALATIKKRSGLPPLTSRQTAPALPRSPSSSVHGRRRAR